MLYYFYKWLQKLIICCSGNISVCCFYFAPKRNRARRAGINTFAAVDALPVADFDAVHFAFMDTGVTAYTFGCVHLNAKIRQLVEQAVKCPQRADKTAEGTINNNTGNNSDDQ